MDELLEILEENCPGVDFEGQEHLIDDGILDSLSIVMLVGALNEAYDISIGAEDLVPENFNSAEAPVAAGRLAVTLGEHSCAVYRMKQ